MKENCLDIGIIQAFLDGELEMCETARVSTHVAHCDHCAVLLADAENESALVFSVLEREFNTLVPTQRLWNKINDSLQTERESRPFWKKAYAYAVLVFANPSLAAAASLVIVIGIFSVVWINRTGVSTETQVNVATTDSRPAPAPPVVDSVPVVPGGSVDRVVEPRPRTGYTVQQASYRPESRRTDAAPGPPVSSSGYLPGEESYVRTISSLTRTVDEQKAGGVMRPGEQIAYERNMAVVNDAIAKMKDEVRRNPRNESAKQVLYSSYQNKIDLLNSVSQKEELMVSMR